MNTWEVDEARDRHRGHPVKGLASALLAKVRDLADERSDGWAYWPKPCRACKKLQELIQEKDPSKVTVANLKKAVAPVKAFFTRMGWEFPELQEAR